MTVLRPFCMAMCSISLSNVAFSTPRRPVRTMLVSRTDRLMASQTPPTFPGKAHVHPDRPGFHAAPGGTIPGGVIPDDRVAGRSTPGDNVAGIAPDDERAHADRRLREEEDLEAASDGGSLHTESGLLDDNLIGDAVPVQRRPARAERRPPDDG